VEQRAGRLKKKTRKDRKMRLSYQLVRLGAKKQSQGEGIINSQHRKKGSI